MVLMHRRGRVAKQKRAKRAVPAHTWTPSQPMATLLYLMFGQMDSAICTRTKCLSARCFRIMSLVSEVNKGRLPFWIDTCYVPREIEQRKKAIRLMNKTYRTAARVLVLDATLQLFKCHRGLDPQKGTWLLRIDNLWDAGADGGNL
jgi:hypothetical protein